MSMRIGDDPLDLQPQDAREFGFPFAHVRLAGRDDGFGRGDADRQDLEALGVGVRHHLGDGGEVDLERIDVQVGQSDLAAPATRSALRDSAASSGCADPSTSGRRGSSADERRRCGNCAAAPAVCRSFPAGRVCRRPGRRASRSSVSFVLGERLRFGRLSLTGRRRTCMPSLAVVFMSGIGSNKRTGKSPAL